MTKELLKQALDALEFARGNINPERGYADDLEADVEAAATAIRAHLAQPPATSADYAQGYAEGFNDACKPAQPSPVLEEFDMADDGGCPVCGEDGGTSCGMQNCGLLYADPVPADEMDAVASQYAHKMALDLECILAEYGGSWYNTAMRTLGEYRSAMNAIHERESPTFMGEPSIAASPEVPK